MCFVKKDEHNDYNHVIDAVHKGPEHRGSRGDTDTP